MTIPVSFGSDSNPIYYRSSIDLVNYNIFILAETVCVSQGFIVSGATIKQNAEK